MNAATLKSQEEITRESEVKELIISEALKALVRIQVRAGQLSFS